MVDKNVSKFFLWGVSVNKIRNGLHLHRIYPTYPQDRKGGDKHVDMQIKGISLQFQLFFGVGENSVESHPGRHVGTWIHILHSTNIQQQQQLPIVFGFGGSWWFVVVWWLCLKFWLFHFYEESVNLKSSLLITYFIHFCVIIALTPYGQLYLRH